MSKLMWVGVALTVSGVLSGTLEQVFYGGRLDENNVVQESLFLPLAYILILLGAGLIAVATVRHLIKRNRGEDN